MTDLSRTELGDLLRTRRARLRPEAVGLPPGRRRRTVGLRREEVAELAGIGVDWYTRLEQGRAVAPSPTTVDALARALRLDKAEHAHLKALAGTAGRRGFVPENVPPTSARLSNASASRPMSPAAAGSPGVERGGGRNIRFRKARGRRAQHSFCVLTLDEGRALFGRDGSRRAAAWWPGFARPRTFGRATRPSSLSSTR